MRPSTQVDATAVLAEGGWRRSVGIGAGRHYRRGREHLRVHRGRGHYHIDASDPWVDPIGHVIADVLGISPEEK